jgi:hypothetical protein
MHAAVLHVMQQHVTAALLPAVSPDARPIVGAVIGAALAAGVVYAGVQAKQKRDGAAVIDLYNYIVEVRVKCFRSERSNTAAHVLAQHSFPQEVVNVV